MEFREKTGFQFEINPQNFHEFIPRVYSRLSLPASSLIFANKEPREEVSQLEKLRSLCEEQQLKAIFDFKQGNSQITQKYGINSESLRKVLEKNQVIRERYIVDLIKAKGFEISYDVETRVTSIDFGDGKKIFGTVYSILDAHPDLLKFESIFESFETPILPDSKHIMSLKTIEGDAYKSTSSISGSYTQNEINPYPTDYDFREYFLINADSIKEGIEIFQRIILSNFNEFKNNNNIAITEFKMGYHTYISEDGTTKRLKLSWTEDEVRNGFKKLEIDGKVVTISFYDAVINLESNDKVKFDFLTDISGIFRESSKILNFKFKNSKNEEIFEHLSNPNSVLQEIFFEDPTNFGIVSKISDIKVIGDFYAEMLTGAVTLADCSNSNSETCNPLKAVKRTYNLLKTSGLIQQGRELSSVFNTEYSKLYQISDYLHSALKVIKLLEISLLNGTSQQPISKDNLVKSFHNLLVDIQGDEKISKYSLPVILDSTLIELQKNDPNLKLISERIQRLRNIINQEVNSRVYQFLLRNASFMQIKDQAQEVLIQ